MKVSVQKQNKYTQQVATENHHFLLADEPQASGGHDLGPSPWELVMAGMGSCTSITLQMYAERKGWNLEDIKIILEKEPDTHAIQIKIEITGDLTDDQVSILQKVATKCPVVKSLGQGLLIQETLTKV